MSELVLVVPTSSLVDVLTSRGFVADPAGFSTLAGARFVPRDAAEHDETFRQVIPYLILRAPDGRVFSYARNRKGAESRLHDLRSVGVGGHLNPPDLPSDLGCLATDPRDVLATAARRELSEEVAGVEPDASPRWLGFIFADDEPVSRVHLGIVYAFRADPCRVRLTGEGRMSDGRFCDLATLRRERASYEGWSRFVIDHLTTPTSR